MKTCRRLDANKAVVTVFLTALFPLCYPITGFAVEFASPVSYPVGLSPASVVVADFNGDGHPDIAVANSGSGNVSILLGNGDGTYKPAVNFDAGMASPTSIAISDANNDGIQDLAVWSSSSPVSSSLSILLGNGDGTFRAAKTTPLPTAVDQTTLDLAIADFNVDHKPDLAVLVNDTSGGSSRIFLLAGNGDGTFQAPKQSSDALSTVVGSNVQYLVTGDFNNDAKPDLAVQVSGGVEILLGQGDGTFHAGATVPLAGGVVGDLKVGDFNGDGKVDLLTKSDKRYDKILSHVRDSYINLILGNGDGSFQPEEHIEIAELVLSAEGGYARGRTIGTPTAGDFNGDGKLDLAYSIGDYDLNRSAFPGIRLGRADGTFSPPVPFENPNGNLLWSSLVAKDLNGDKLSDLIVPDIGSNAIVIELNTTPTSGADLGIIEPSDNLPSTDGHAINYSAVVLNEGPEDATEVTFADTLPTGVSFASASATQGSCNQSSGVVTCTIGSLPSASDATVTINVNLKPVATGGTLSNRMNVTATEQDEALANNTAVLDTPVVTLTVATDGTGKGTVASDPAGINCGAVCSQAYVWGGIIALIPTASAGSAFSGWSGACNFPDPNGCALPLWSDQTVTATFKASTGGGEPGGGGSSGSSGSGGGGGAFAGLELCGMLLISLWRAFVGLSSAHSSVIAHREISTRKQLHGTPGRCESVLR
jgi:uncharacterized repeat protein (TIGR01451 family)